MFFLVTFIPWKVKKMEAVWLINGLKKKNKFALKRFSKNMLTVFHLMLF